MKLVEGLQDIAQEKGITAAQLALAWGYWQKVMISYLSQEQEDKNIYLKIWLRWIFSSMSMIKKILIQYFV
jgi:diketogulonate reductase-like aldo/keto reductase